MQLNKISLLPLKERIRAPVFCIAELDLILPRFRGHPKGKSLLQL